MSENTQPEVDPRVHKHYFKDVRHLEFIDVYRVLDLFEQHDPAIQHAIKKLLVPGQRGAGKTRAQDVKEAIDSLKRWQAMQAENEDRALPLSTK